MATTRGSRLHRAAGRARDRAIRLARSLRTTPPVRLAVGGLAASVAVTAAIALTLQLGPAAERDALAVGPSTPPDPALAVPPASPEAPAAPSTPRPQAPSPAPPSEGAAEDAAPAEDARPGPTAPAQDVPTTAPGRPEGTASGSTRTGSTGTGTAPAPTTPDGLTISSTSVRPGQRIDVSGSGYRPRSTVRLVLFSDPIELGSVETDDAGAFVADVEIPEEAPSGDHTVVAIGVDGEGNERVLSLGVSLDRDGPQIVSVSVSRPTVSPGDTFTISIRATDPSGVRSVSFSTSVAGMQRDFCGQQMTFASGTTTDATWTYDCVVPADVIGGEYTITPYAEDELGNFTNLNQGSSSPVRGTFVVE